VGTNGLRYRDDIILIATSVELQELVNSLNTASKKYDLLINAGKTKLMIAGKNSCDILIDNQKIEVIGTFPYLGSLITTEADCVTDIRARLNKGETGYIVSSLRKIWKCHDIAIDTKVRLLQALWPVATYSCENGL